MPVAASAVLNLCCLLILWFAVAMDFGFKRRSKSFHMTLLFSFFLAVQTFSVFMYISYAIVGDGPLFSTNPISALNILFIEYHYDNYLQNFIRIIPKFACLLLVLSAMVCTFTALGFELFDPHSEEAEQYFPNYGNGLWNMLMVLCGSNWPGPMIPALENNRFYFFFFSIYIIIGDWGLLNLLLGFVYLFFRAEQMEIKQSVERVRREHLQQAFTLLDTDALGYFTYHQMDSLVSEGYCSFIETLHPPTQEERLELIMLLDEKQQGIITKTLFDKSLDHFTYRSLKS